jgi:dTDP-4-amino-4,6-dideoxygalactose transaminase
MQSAIGRVLLQKLPSFVETRRKNAAILTQFFSKLPGLRVAVPAPGIHHSYYKFYAFVRPENLRDGWNRDRIMAAISAEGIPCFSGSCSEICLEKAFPPEMRPAQRLEIARELGETSLMFLVHPTLGEKEMQDTCRAVKKVFEVATEEP